MEKALALDSSRGLWLLKSADGADEPSVVLEERVKMEKITEVAYEGKSHTKGRKRQMVVKDEERRWSGWAKGWAINGARGQGEVGGDLPRSHMKSRRDGWLSKRDGGADEPSIVLEERVKLEVDLPNSHMKRRKMDKLCRRRQGHAPWCDAWGCDPWRACKVWVDVCGAVVY